MDHRKGTRVGDHNTGWEGGQRGMGKFWSRDNNDCEGTENKEKQERQDQTINDTKKNDKYIKW